MGVSNHGSPLTVYALELYGGKYYLDKTRDLNTRLRQHFGYEDINGKTPYGNSWLERWRPVRIHHLYRNSLDTDLDNHTLEYMHKFGIENVRGGSYSNDKLSLGDREKIRQNWYRVIGNAGIGVSGGGGEPFIIRHRRASGARIVKL